MCGLMFFFFFKQKTAYEMRISDWSSDVCSSDLELADRSVEALIDDAAHRLGEGGVADPVQHHLRDGALAAFGFAGGFIIDGLRQALEGAVMVQLGRASCRERVCQYV